MFEAAYSGSVADTAQVLREAPELLYENRGVSGSYLHSAAKWGHVDLCQFLMDQGLDVNCRDDYRDTPLGRAAEHGRMDVAQLLLARGAWVDGYPDSIATPLLSAAAEGHLDMVKLLLEHGAEINREHLRRPATALDYAIIYQVKNTGQDKVAEYLQSQGGICPYAGHHDWTGTPGQAYIEHIEQALSMNANPLVQVQWNDLPDQITTDVRKIRFVPRKYEHQLCFTVGHQFRPAELALCLPSAWPLNRDAMKLEQYHWPIDWLHTLAALHAQAPLVHGQLLSSKALGCSAAVPVEPWVVVSKAELEPAAAASVPWMSRTLIVVPHTAKKKLNAASAQAAADKLREAKWNKLAVPIELSQAPSTP
jgi:hypothetical protein